MRGFVILDWCPISKEKRGSPLFQHKLCSLMIKKADWMSCPERDTAVTTEIHKALAIFHNFRKNKWSSLGRILLHASWDPGLSFCSATNYSSKLHAKFFSSAKREEGILLLMLTLWVFTIIIISCYHLRYWQCDRTMLTTSHYIFCHLFITISLKGTYILFSFQGRI